MRFPYSVRDIPEGPVVMREAAAKGMCRWAWGGEGPRGRERDRGRERVRE